MIALKLQKAFIEYGFLQITKVALDILMPHFVHK